MVQVKSTTHFKKQKQIFLFGVLVFVEFIIFITSFRFLRDVFSTTPILEGRRTSIGYAQFTGYPFYLDTILFCALLVCPVLFVSLIKLVSNRWK